MMNVDDDAEVAAMGAIIRALDRLGDDESRQRVLAYVLARFKPSPIVASQRTSGTVVTVPSPVLSPQEGTAQEIAGIARITASGELAITVRDLKARSGLDAAVRLAHVAIFAYHRLLGQPLSSSKGLTPILKQWRLYDGNTRTRLAREKGILRNGDELSLDAHATRDAEAYVAEILDSTVEGTWRPKR